jgi:hypothetical protein
MTGVGINARHYNATSLSIKVQSSVLPLLGIPPDSLLLQEADHHKFQTGLL